MLQPREREELETLRAEVAILKGALKADSFQLPSGVSLTQKEAVLVKRLAAAPAGGIVTKSQMYAALYYDRLDGGPDPSIIDVFMCRIRKKVAPYGVKVDTVWDCGFVLATDSHARMRALLDPTAR